MISISDDGKRSGIGNLNQRDTILYFMKNFQFQRSPGKNGLSTKV